MFYGSTDYTDGAGDIEKNPLCQSKAMSDDDTWFWPQMLTSDGRVIQRPNQRGTFIATSTFK